MVFRGVVNDSVSSVSFCHVQSRVGRLQRPNCRVGGKGESADADTQESGDREFTDRERFDRDRCAHSFRNCGGRRGITIRGDD